MDDDWQRVTSSQIEPLKAPGLLLELDGIVEAQSDEDLLREAEEDLRGFLDLTSDDIFDLVSDSGDPAVATDLGEFEEVARSVSFLFFLIDSLDCKESNVFVIKIFDYNLKQINWNSRIITIIIIFIIKF